MKFCPKCGKETKKLYDNLCKDCSADDVELFKYTPKDITICASCNIVHDGRKRYKDMPRDKAIEEIIRKRTIVNKKLEDPHIRVEFTMPSHHAKKGFKFKSKATLKLKVKTGSGVKIDEEYFVPVPLRYITCERCSKKNTNYFEGILQIRHPDKKRIKDVIEHLDKIMEAESKRSVFATNKIESKNGVDVYITSQKHIKDIGRKLFEKYGGTFKINEQLFSRDNLKSKNLYRVNVLIRLPDFKNGDAIFVKNKLLIIKRIKGHNIIGRDLKRNKDVTVHCKDEEIETIAKDFLETTITLEKPAYEVLNPETYQSDRVQNPEVLEGGKIGDKVEVFLWNGIWVR